MIKQKFKYTIINTKDISNIGARRLSVLIQLDEEYSKDQIKEIIKELTNKFKKYDYTSFKGINLNTTKSDVIWLYIAKNKEDLDNYRYIQAMWINKKLDERYRPVPIFANDYIDDIQIKWIDGEEIWEN